MTLQPLLMNFLIYEENLFSFLSVCLLHIPPPRKGLANTKKTISTTTQARLKKIEFQIYVTFFAWHV
jgi:hypothetical protein